MHTATPVTLAEPSPLQAATTSTRREPYLQFNNVSIAFESNQVLDGVSFSVMPGETVCVLGKSGTGNRLVCVS